MTLPPDFTALDVLADRLDDHRLWLARNTEWPVEILGRQWHREMVVFAMLNPSKARGEGVGDPTQRKCNGFAARLHARRYGIINLFSLSTPYPEQLFTFGYEAAVGALNDDVTREVMDLCKARQWPFVAAWGTCSKLSKIEHEFVQTRVKALVRYARAIDLPIYCLEATSDGTPRHPLMLGYEHSKLLPWDER